MGQTTGTALGSGALRVLNQPQAIEAATDANGIPRTVRRGGRDLRIDSLLDIWRIDDGWWREPEFQVRRLYFEVTLENGALLTLYHDLLRGVWYEQRS